MQTNQKKKETYFQNSNFTAEEDQTKVSWKKGLQVVRELLKKLYTRRQRGTKDKVLLHVLQTRAFVAHTTWTILRLAQYAAGDAWWFQDLPLKCAANRVFMEGEDISCVLYDYDEELVESIRPTV